MLVELCGDDAEGIIGGALAVLQSEGDDFVQAAFDVLVKRNGAKVVEFDMDAFAGKLLKVGNELFLFDALGAIEDDVYLISRDHSANEISCHTVLAAYPVDGPADLLIAAGIQLANDVVARSFR